MVKLKLNSYTVKIKAIKFVRHITALGLTDAKELIEGSLPVTLKEYDSATECQAAIDSFPQQEYLQTFSYEIENDVSAALIRSTGIGIVTGNPNEIVELQSNHLLSIVQSQDGSKLWAFMPNNNAGEKWVEKKSCNKDNIEALDLEFDSIKIKKTELSECILNKSRVASSDSLPNIQLVNLGVLHRLRANNSDALYILLKSGNDKEWVKIVERVW